MALSVTEQLSRIADLQAQSAWKTFLRHLALQQRAVRESAMEALRKGELHRATLLQGESDAYEQMTFWAGDLSKSLVEGEAVEWVE